MSQYILAVSVILASTAALGQPRSVPRVEPITPGKKEPMAPADLFNAYLARIGDLAGPVRDAPLDMDRARALVDFLHEDMGVNYLNGRWQQLVCIEIAHAAKNEQADEQALDLLRSTVLNYAVEGGGGHNPCTEVDLACALARLGGAAFPECDAESTRLREHARKWAQELGIPTYISLVAREDEEIEQFVRRRDRLPAMPRSASEGQLAEWRAAEAAIQALTKPDGQLSPERITRAGELLRRDFGDREANSDLLARMLVAYRKILEPQTWERRAFKPVVQAIDGELVKLVTKPPSGIGKKHWLFWADAAAALKHRASHDLKRCVHERLEAVRDEELQRRLRRAEDAFRRS